MRKSKEANEEMAKVVWTECAFDEQTLREMGIPTGPYKTLNLDDVNLPATLAESTRVGGLSDGDWVERHRRAIRRRKALPALVGMGERPTTLLGGAHRCQALRDEGVRSAYVLLVPELDGPTAQLVRMALNSTHGRMETAEDQAYLAARHLIDFGGPLDRLAHQLNLDEGDLAAQLAKERLAREAAESEVKLGKLTPARAVQIARIARRDVRVLVAERVSRASKISDKHVEDLVANVLRCRTLRAQRTAIDRFAEEHSAVRAAEAPLSDRLHDDIRRIKNKLAKLGGTLDGLSDAKAEAIARDFWPVVERLGEMLESRGLGADAVESAGYTTAEAA